MKQFVTHGIVLARTNFGESDRILTILTYNHGKIRAIAKGVRKLKSKLAAGIELFSISQLTYIQGKSDIFTLTSTRLEKHYGNIVKDINRTMFSYEILKNFNRITEDNADSDYFELLKITFASLNEPTIDLPIIQFWLNLQLLKLGGHTPNLQTDTGGQKLNQSSPYDFDVSKMTFVKQANGVYNQRHIKLLRLGIILDSPKDLTKITDLHSILPNCLQLSNTMVKKFA